MNALATFLRDARILIVDDEPVNVRLLEYHLQDRGQMNFRSTTKFVPPGDPVPTSEYAAPLPVPGAPTVSPTKKP